MRRYYTVLLMLIFVFNALNINAQVHEVSGEQSGSWADTVLLVGDVVVNETDCLVVNPGTVVLSDMNYKIMVYGFFSAIGSNDSPIVFSVADTTGFADYQFITGGWGGIEFRGTKETRIEHCEFSYGKTGIGGCGAALHFVNANNVVVSDCVFHDNIFRFRGGGICAEHSKIKVNDCEAFNNQGYGYDGSYTYGGGFYFINCDVEIENMSSHDNYIPAGYGGGCSFDSCNVVLDKAVFYNNIATNGGGLGLQRSKHLDVKMANVLAYNNSVVHYGGGMAMATSDPEITNFTLVDNICGGGGGAGMQMAFDSAPIISNSIIYGNRAIYLDIYGDTTEYYYGSQIWLWGDDNFPLFQNGDVQYGFDSIYHSPTFFTEEYYIDMINADPMFLDVDNHNYRLTENSPCVDAGLADMTGYFVPETDIQGGPRIFNGRIDMGCYELGDYGVNEISKNENDITVAPNPLNMNSFCAINLNKATNAVIRLISLNGMEISKIENNYLNPGENIIQLGRLVENIEKTNRIYLLIIDTQDNKYCKKVIY